MKKYILFSIFITASLLCRAQFYFNFEESGTFYKKQSLLKTAGYMKEHIVVKQMKNKILEDSFRIVVISYNSSGIPVSTHTGSRWNQPAIKDSIKHNTAGVQTASSNAGTELPASFFKTDASNAVIEPEGPDTIRGNVFRYEIDSVQHVKKVFLKRVGFKEMLARLVFYDETGKILKIDFSPENERVYYNEYQYKKNKLKIYTVTKNDRICNERITFNDAGQVIKREVDIFRLGGWTYNVYYFTYTSDNLLETEKKTVDGRVYTVATHYYEHQ